MNATKNVDLNLRQGSWLLPREKHNSFPRLSITAELVHVSSCFWHDDMEAPTFHCAFVVVGDEGRGQENKRSAKRERKARRFLSVPLVAI